MDPQHRTSDLQSLLLTEAAIAALIQQPHLGDAVLSTLDHWDRVAAPDSQPLRDEWRDILLKRDFQRALALTDRGQQLRQASPLGRALPSATRLEIIRSCKGHSSNT